MELVDGVPITQYCRDRGLVLRARLELFRQICDAVHHAHTRFIVHRDLKLANIPVTADGMPKVLDFGVATLLEDPLATGPDHREARNAARTEAGPGPLTPGYASKPTDSVKHADCRDIGLAPVCAHDGMPRTSFADVRSGSVNR